AGSASAWSRRSSSTCPKSRTTTTRRTSTGWRPTARFPTTGRGRMVDVLVTGGAGLIGSNYVRHALAAHPDWHITTLDKLTYAGRLENLRDLGGHLRHTFVRGDIADRAVAAPLVRRSEIVVHFAAET